MKFLTTRYHYFLLAALILLATFFHASWILTDGRYQPFVDPYPLRTLAVADHLEANGLRQLPELMLATRIRARSPLYSFGMALFVLAFGRSLDAMLGFNLLMNGVMIAGAFFAGSLLKNRRTGLLAALFVATLAPLANLVRLARPHAVIPAVVSIWLLFLLLMLKRRTVKAVWGLCAALVFGFWLHPNTFYLLPLPTAVFTVYALFLGGDGAARAQLPGWQAAASLGENGRSAAAWVWGRINQPFVWRGVLPGFLLVGVITAVWYLSVWQDVTALAQESAANWHSVRYGFNQIEAGFWWYLWTFPGAISIFFTAVFLAGLLINLLAGQRYPFMLSLIFILMYLGMALRQGTLAWMNFAGILPVVALVTAVFLNDLVESSRASDQMRLKHGNSRSVSRLFAQLLLFSAVGLAVFNFALVTTRLPENAQRLAETLGSPLEVACGWRMNIAYCSNPPLNQDWHEREMLQAILAAGGCLETPCSAAIVTESAEIFSFSSLRYFLAQEFPEASLEILPIRTQDLYSMDWLTTDFLIYIPQMQNNAYTNSVVAFLQAPPAHFAEVYDEIGQIPLPRGWQAHILQRNRLLDAQETAEFIQMLAMPEAFKAGLDTTFTFRNMQD